MTGVQVVVSDNGAPEGLIRYTAAHESDGETK
jgi:hypothetical protein